MRKFLKLFVFAAAVVFTLQGCSRDELVGPNPDPDTDRGVYVLSEGSFSTGPVLSYYNITDSMFTQNILSQAIGVFADGMISSGNDLFVTSQGNFGSPGKIYRMNLSGSVQASNDVGNTCYSLTEANNKLYITNGPASNVSVVNKGSLAEITTIGVGVYPQEILSIDNYVFVCNTSDLFNSIFDSTVSVIDAQADLLIANVIVRRDPSALARTNDGKLLVGCPGTNSYIYLIDPNSFNKLDSFLIPEGCFRDIAVDKNSNNIYFIAGGFASTKIKKMDLSTGAMTDFLGLDPNGLIYYGLTFDRESNRLFIALATPSFSSDGKLKIVRPDGSTEAEYTTGIAPRRLLIK